MAQDLSTDQVKSWRSIITLIVFIVTNLIALFPFHIPVYIPRPLWNVVLDVFSSIRVISPRKKNLPCDSNEDSDGNSKRFERFRFPMNFVTAPLIADLFLLAILAIGRDEVYGGTIGADNIHPIDIMVFFISLAYIAISIDASGLIRWLAFKVLTWGGKLGHRLFFYLYVFFFFALTSFIGNDPVILSGTAFLAYLMRASSNIEHPRAWIHTQFAVANIGSAILVSSNPTNLILAGAFKITFIKYSANMIVPVLATIIVLFPFLLYIVFPDPRLIPYKIEMHDLPEELKGKTAINPNIPNGRRILEDEEDQKLISGHNKDSLHLLEEILNPFLDKTGAIVGAVIMAVTIVTVLALNAATQKIGEHSVYYVTLPAAVMMFCWDIGYGWTHRKETRRIACDGREEMDRARTERVAKKAETKNTATLQERKRELRPSAEEHPSKGMDRFEGNGETIALEDRITPIQPLERTGLALQDKAISLTFRNPEACIQADDAKLSSLEIDEKLSSLEMDEKGRRTSFTDGVEESQQLVMRSTLVSQAKTLYRWSQETFPTATTVATHLPFALVPFAFSMFVLVQALVTKGWVPVFAHGWDHWVMKTGTVGAVGGMGFVSVILCNFAGTNIGTTILLCRVIQAWQDIRVANGIYISNREFWGTVYSMAIGVNYGAFSAAFSASLAGLLWRDILARKHIRVRSIEFARVNLPIIAISMTIGCVVLVGQVYVVRDNKSYNGR